MGRSLIPRLVAGGHEVLALARRGSEGKLPAGCTVVSGNALDPTTFANRLDCIDPTSIWPE